MMREFWAALSCFYLTVFLHQDGIHLGWRRGCDWEDGGPEEGSSLTVEQVQDLRAELWDGARLYREELRDEVTSLKAETAVVETLCMKTGIRLMYKTLGPDSWDLVLA